MITERNKDYIKVRIDKTDDILDVFLYIKDSYNINALPTEEYEYKGVHFKVGDTLIVRKDSVEHGV